mmetsp:Transcript_137676/g.427726  ORF Transcript_137676/g.427726 Transcript_137676/m.427726 type:complete len:255 (+) Transcript_137676:120-884(+)
MLEVDRKDAERPSADLFISCPGRGRRSRRRRLAPGSRPAASPPAGRRRGLRAALVAGAPPAASGSPACRADNVPSSSTPMTSPRSCCARWRRCPGRPPTARPRAPGWAAAGAATPARPSHFGLPAGWHPDGRPPGRGCMTFCAPCSAGGRPCRCSWCYSGSGGSCPPFHCPWCCSCPLCHSGYSGRSYRGIHSARLPSPAPSPPRRGRGWRRAVAARCARAGARPAGRRCRSSRAASTLALTSACSGPSASYRT